MMTDSWLAARPDSICFFQEDGAFYSVKGEESLQHGDVTVCAKAHESAGKVEVTLAATVTPVCYLRLTWRRKVPAGAKYLGDAWERSYGDLQWRGMDASRTMPWYFLWNKGKTTGAAGVMVRPAAFAMWQVNSCCVTLWLDVRCGTRGVLLGGREISVATVLFRQYSEISSFAAARCFCQEMCTDPLPVEEPIYGGNNWYYAYANCTHQSLVDDSRRLAALVPKAKNRPYMVIDDGWSIWRGFSQLNCGPWDGSNKNFPDMARLAAEMADCGVRPGLWFRPLWNRSDAVKSTWRLPHDDGAYMDPTIPEVVALVQDDIRRFAGWGYQLLKHDFSTCDIFGGWGFAMRNFPAGEGNWCFADRSRTSAQVVVDFYRAILEAAGSMKILGCNTIGHLGAGLMHLSRTGDDTSGQRWDRTRKMGVNTLAFRLCQHGTFFQQDADCVGITQAIPWKYNRQWLERIVASGSSLFISLAPNVCTPRQFKELSLAMDRASRWGESSEPLDWMDNTCPAIWRDSDGKVRRCQWYEADGARLDFA